MQIKRAWQYFIGPLWKPEKVSINDIECYMELCFSIKCQCSRVHIAHAGQMLFLMFVVKSCIYKIHFCYEFMSNIQIHAEYKNTLPNFGAPVMHYYYMCSYCIWLLNHHIQDDRYQTVREEIQTMSVKLSALEKMMERAFAQLGSKLERKALISE